ncbi:ChaC-like protein [Protomyces lactucae-debilis]|uniref:glutathione-specific gamma-glutamylcyclotransferase n=1 Tax=Protomyces lactucae-debilis TaxID=2754530 RepID=A0A1Y2FGW1_PROLT|nr:ChaC-like protein [Protomyces lactucae-debilis]ORY83169.1 ChaC-like protein [Protomyces lactucae-debilis]
MRVFGYGSLIYKPPPHVAHATPGYITTHIRRFWQASEDHRGTPERPGRVVTLLSRAEFAAYGKAEEERFITKKQLQDDSDDGIKTWGMVYTIIPERIDEVRAYLGIREINGYTLDQVDVFTPEEGCIQAEVFIGTTENPQFTVQTDLDSLAQHILDSQGPSGPNREYLYLLEAALRTLALGSGDLYIEDLTKRVRHLEEVSLARS